MKRVGSGRKARNGEGRTLIYVGSIMYAMLCTKLNPAFAMGFVSRFLSNTGLQHWYAVKRILRYIK